MLAPYTTAVVGGPSPSPWYETLEEQVEAGGLSAADAATSRASRPGIPVGVSRKQNLLRLVLGGCQVTAGPDSLLPLSSRRKRWHSCAR